MLDNLVNIYDDFTKNERTQSLSRFALENAFDFTKRVAFGEQVTLLRNFQIFKGKGVKRFIGVIKIPASQGLDAQLRFYDYLVTKDLETKSTSIVELFVPGFDCGRFRIKPKNGLSKLFSPNFSKSNKARFYKRFNVDSEIEISESIIDLMLSSQKMTVEGFQDTFLFYHRKKPITISKIFQYVEFAEEFLSYMDSIDSGDFV